MRKRIGLLAMLVVIAAGSLAVWSRTHESEPTRFTRENFRRIQVGMSKAEVEAILGPAGDFATRETVVRPEAWSSSEEVGSGISSVRGWMAEWEDDRVKIWVSSDLNGSVIHASYVPVELIERGPLDNFLWRAKRQWRR